MAKNMLRSINIQNFTQEQEEGYIKNLVTVLGEHSRDINLALAMAIKYQKENMAYILIEQYGCNPYMEYKNNLSYIDFAKQLGYEKIANAMMSRALK